MKNNRSTIILISLIVIAVGISIYAVFIKGKKQFSQINSYTECAEAGHPILQGHTASETIIYECTTPNGRTFTKIIE